jgi:putative transposase
LLSEHLHCIWTLPEQDHDSPTGWKRIKTLFSKAYLKEGCMAGNVSQSKARKGQVETWQRRYWEHTIFDEKDLERHIEIIHYNPVKHELVKSAVELPWSSFHQYVNKGIYAEGWGCGHMEEANARLVGE